MTSRPSADYYATARDDIARMTTKRSAAVLELGCGTGATARLLVDEGIARFVDAAELDQISADVAAPHCRQLYVGDVEAGAFEVFLANGPYDLIVAGDVLEHLRDPWRTVDRLSSALAPGGEIIASVPNVRSLRVVVPLVLFGRFTYQEQGILDATHLRFFTRKTAIELLSRSGLDVAAVARNFAGEHRRRWLARIAPLFGDLLVDQFVVRAVRTSVPAVA